MDHPPDRQRLLSLGMSPSSAEEFLKLYARYRHGTAPLPDWDSLASPDPAHLPSWEALPEPPEAVTDSDLARLVVLKLNGGLGTSMGCPGPKSLIEVKERRSFLDLILEQMEALQARAPVPLYLMNSFYTQEPTESRISRYSGPVPVFTFQQNRFPRLDAETGDLLDPARFREEAWYPPGHGDFYFCVQHLGLLARWLEEGREVLFLSNADNLGAGVDPRILHFMLEKQIPFLMEMTPKTPADVKGGTLYQKDGRLHLLELAHVPEQHQADFLGTRKFRVFNTNNIWIHLPQLMDRLNQGGLDLDVIVNRKNVRGQAVIQLETAVGAGLEHFEGAVGLVVPRTRFAPVKTTADLLKVQSDLFVVEHGRLRPNPERKRADLPQVTLGDTFRNLDEYSRRFRAVPSLVDLESLVLEGDILFEGPAVLRGKVSLKARNRPLVVPAGAVLEDETRVT